MNSAPVSTFETDAHTTARSLAPVPKTLADTGLPRALLEDLTIKLIFDAGGCDAGTLVRRSALSSPVVEAIVELLRNDGRIEIRAPAEGSRALRYALTDAGRAFARQALERSGYIGPAPVPANVHAQLIRAQSVRDHRVNQERVHGAFEDVVIEARVLDQLGAAMHSGKGIFIYGVAGSGKTYVCQRLSRLLGPPILIPHAVAAGDTIVNVFDAALHVPARSHAEGDVLLLDHTHDQRFVRCERPFIVSGGELDASMLEVRYDETSNRYEAPLQLKASGGIYLIDDLGRQKIAARELFNRWIVPMESRVDYLNLRSGARLEVPFDLVLIFSTNLDPAELADAAFLRRIGHKIRFDALSREAYHAIWGQVCKSASVVSDARTVDRVIDAYHLERGMPLLACHPRDLVNAALDFIDYEGAERRLTDEHLDKAWTTNFVRPSRNDSDGITMPATASQS